MKKMIFPGIPIFVLISVVVLCAGCGKEDPDKVLSDYVDGVNAQCPMAMDDNMRLDNAKVLPNKTIQYTYTLENYTQDQMSAEIQENMKTEGAEIIKNDSASQQLKDLDVTFKYVYQDSAGQELLTLTFGPQDYK
jgi:hypothetical protein